MEMPIKMMTNEQIKDEIHVKEHEIYLSSRLMAMRINKIQKYIDELNSELIHRQYK